MSEFYHFGTKRHSGRYPWGSGKDNYQHYTMLRNEISKLKADGATEKEIASYFNLSIRDLRAEQSIGRSETRAVDAATALKLHNKGMSPTAIGKQMGINESSVRSLLDKRLAEKANSTKNISEALKESVGKGEFVDVGVGTESHLGISRHKLQNAIKMLKDEGYKIHYTDVEQLGTGKPTSIMILGAPDSKWTDANANKANLKIVGYYSEDNGKTVQKIKDPVVIKDKRIGIVYAEDGGNKKDGVIELRRGVEDLTLGNSRYMQVRIAVEGDKYLKGMAIYADDLPPGIDIRFNTNKSKDVPRGEVLKDIKADKDNPFGATIRQFEYTDSKGKKNQSPINIVNDEGDWSGWSKALSSQVLSKQPVSLAREQLALAHKARMDEYDEISKLTNPTVKKKLLQEFADGADGAAVSLKAAALPRQASHVILPVNSLKEGEVYAPGYRNGETVALIRYPHGGKFEIPQLTVNNSNREGSKIIGNGADAIGINHKVASRLSGADFDGDAVLVIPNSSGKLKSSSPLKGLKDFDPQASYPAVDGMRVMTKKNLQGEMGKITNLIADMQIRGANESDVAAAVRHSMVIIDSEKHKLNYTKSAEDNDIAGLKTKYQGGPQKGASTLISRASSRAVINEVKRTKIDPATGELVRIESGRSYTNKKGKEIVRTQNSKKMLETKDANTLSSGTAMETVYAKYANSMKVLANDARKQMVNTKDRPYSKSAAKVYAEEVESMNGKLNIAIRNKPLERRAQLIGNAIYKAKVEANPEMDNDDRKRLRNQSLALGRERANAKRNTIIFTDREWQAVEAGAVSPSKLSQMLNNADMDQVRGYSTPKSNKIMSTSKQQRMVQMLNNNYTLSEVADALGVSTSTIQKSMPEYNEKNGGDN